MLKFMQVRRWTYKLKVRVGAFFTVTAFLFHCQVSYKPNFESEFHIGYSDREDFFKGPYQVLLPLQLGTETFISREIGFYSE